MIKETVQIQLNQSYWLRRKHPNLDGIAAKPLEISSIGIEVPKSQANQFKKKLILKLKI